MTDPEIGQLWTTAVPSLDAVADIQKALQTYHYGSSTYNPSNTSEGALISDLSLIHI